MPSILIKGAAGTSVRLDTTLVLSTSSYDARRRQFHSAFVIAHKGCREQTELGRVWQVSQISEVNTGRLLHERS